MIVPGWLRREPHAGSLRCSVDFDARAAEHPGTRIRSGNVSSHIATAAYGANAATGIDATNTPGPTSARRRPARIHSGSVPGRSRPRSPDAYHHIPELRQLVTAMVHA